MIVVSGPTNFQFHGSEQETQELLNALSHNCTCRTDTDGKILCCASHQLLHDQRALDGLLFARHIEERLVGEEFSDAA